MYAVSTHYFSYKLHSPSSFKIAIGMFKTKCADVLLLVGDAANTVEKTKEVTFEGKNWFTYYAFI
jgi:hypothetical protein